MTGFVVSKNESQELNSIIRSRKLFSSRLGLQLLKLLKEYQVECHLIHFEKPFKNLISTYESWDDSDFRSRIEIPSEGFLINLCLMHFSVFCVLEEFNRDINNQNLLQYLHECLKSIPCISYRLHRTLILASFRITDKLMLTVKRDKEPCTLEEYSRIKRHSSWLKHVEPYLLRFSLSLDDPTYSWLLINRHAFKLETQHVSTSHNADIFIDCEKRLNNLCVLKALARKEDTRPAYLDLIIYNLEGRYEQTCRAYDHQKVPSYQASREFLEAAFMLGKLGDDIDKIVGDNCPRLSQLYRFYHEAKTKNRQSSAIKLKELHDWLSTWSDVGDVSNAIDMTTVADIGGLIAAIHLAHISNEKDKGYKSELIDFSRKFLEQESFARSVVNLDEPDYAWVSNYVILQCLSENCIEWPQGIRQETLLDDGKFCFRLYRGLDDSNLIEESFRAHVSNSQPLRELIEKTCLGALKFNLDRNNSTIASRIMDQLTENVTFRIKSELIMLKHTSPIQGSDNLKLYLELSERINDNRVISEETKRSLARDIFTEVFKSPKLEQSLCESFILGDSDNFSQRLRDVSDIPDGLSDGSILGKIDIEVQCDILLRASSSISSLVDHDIKALFRYELKLLELLFSSKSHKSQALESAYRILGYIRHYSHLLNDLLAGEQMIDTHFACTKDVWMKLGPDLVHLVTLNSNISSQWEAEIKKWIYNLVVINPQNFLYQTCWQLIELKRHKHNSALEEFQQESGPVFLGRTESSRLLKLDDNLAFWSSVKRLIQDNVTPSIDWSLILDQTEAFLKDIRRISKLAAEILYKLSLGLLARLASIKKKQDSDESDNRDNLRLDFILFYRANKAELDDLSAYFDWCAENSNETSIYDSWTRCHCEENFRLLKSTLSRLAEQPLNQQEISAEIANLDSCLTSIRLFIVERRQKFDGKLFMAEIGTKLSRFDKRIGKFALMPIAQNRLDERIIFIHKIEEQMITLDTLQRPRKLTLVGSDGRRMAFCLKAGENSLLVFDFMRLFSSLNEHLSSDERTRKLCKLRHYSAMPLGASISLIEWCDGVTLGCLSKDWIRSTEGRQVEQKILRNTCQAKRSECRLASNFHGDTPEGCPCLGADSRPVSSMKFFYRLLWNRVVLYGLDKIETFKGMKVPSRANTREYRSYLDRSGIYLETLREMLTLMPQDLILNKLWLESISSRELWLKTRTFIASCATSSYVCHLLGVADRHPENILLDTSSGELIHIDLSTCFDVGKKFLIPEMVPFRLTANMQRVCGQELGLEGPFKSHMQSVASLLADRPETFLQMLNEQLIKHYINSSFRDLKHLLHHKYRGRTAAEFGRHASYMFKELKSRLARVDVDLLVEQATSEENWSLMFEGWQPWV